MLWAPYADQWKSYHLEIYESTSKNVMDAMAKDFCTNYPTSTHLEAARIILNYDIMKYIYQFYPHYSSSMAIQAMTVGAPSITSTISPKHKANSNTSNHSSPYDISNIDMFNATCYGIRNQGMLRKAKDELLTEFDAHVEKLWKQLQQMTESFTIGSYLYISSSQTDGRTDHVSDEPKTEEALDLYHDFRKKLEYKHIWLYSYLCIRHDEYIRELQRIEHENPFEHVKHNFRPSEAESMSRQLEFEYMTKKKQAEHHLSVVMDKLDVLNTYFGFNVGKASS